MNELKIFEKSEFGSVRVIMKDGEPWFVASDVAMALGYTNRAKRFETIAKKSIKSTIIAKRYLRLHL